MAAVTVTGPIVGGVHGWPFGRPLDDLAPYGFVEEEYFIEGDASSYRLVGEMTRDGRWRAEPAATAPYRTRVIVYRPSDAAQFNGTVVVSWNNVTAGYDVFGGDSTELLEGRYAFVGVTTQKAGIDGLEPMRQGLLDWDPERYRTLTHPGDDFSYDIFTQVARVLRGDIERRGPGLLGDLEPRHLIAMGGSQSAGRLATYINALHPLTHAFDAYFPYIWFGTGTPLEVGDAVLNIAAAPDPDLEERLRTGVHQLRDDLDVPVMVVNSELEAIACYGIRQRDTDRFRYWEAAGTCHVSA